MAKNLGYAHWFWLINLGNSFSTAVEQTPHEGEVVKPTPGAGLFSSLLYPISSAFLIRSLVEMQHK